MNETNWKPTEEELVSLGFEIKIPFAMLTIDDGVNINRVRYSRIINSFGVEDANTEGPQVYPKSLEELRCLISMMTP